MIPAAYLFTDFRRRLLYDSSAKWKNFPYRFVSIIIHCAQFIKQIHWKNTRISVKNANGTNTVQNNYYDVLDDLKDKYTPYLQTYVDVLSFFDEVIGNLIGMLEDGIGSSNDTFSFLNGKFIQTNLKVILKYLKYSLGQDAYTVGICLIIVGCSLVLSISSSLLLNAIIKEEMEKNKKMEPNTEIREYPQDNQGRIVEYKY